MPANGLDNCKDECNENAECTAIEYSMTASADGNDCCFLLKCDQPVAYPTMEQAPHHEGTWDYTGYVKGMQNAI